MREQHNSTPAPPPSRPGTPRPRPGPRGTPGSRLPGRGAAGFLSRSAGPLRTRVCPVWHFLYSFCLSSFTRQQILAAALKLAERLGCTERIPPLSSLIRRGGYFLRANRLNKSANGPKIEFQNDIVISLLSTFFFFDNFYSLAFFFLIRCIFFWFSFISSSNKFFLFLQP